MKDQNDELLSRSMDEQLSAREQQQLDDALQQSDRLRIEKERLIMIRERMANSSVFFKPGFSDRVMSKIAETGMSANVISLFRKIAYAGVASILLLVFLHIWSGGTFSLDGFLGVESASRDVVTFNVIGH